jgi:hypothetical protein
VIVGATSTIAKVPKHPCDKECPQPPLQMMRQSKVVRHIAGSNNNKQWLVATKARMPSNNQLNFSCIAGASNDRKTTKLSMQ